MRISAYEYYKNLDDDEFKRAKRKFHKSYKFKYTFCDMCHNYIKNEWMYTRNTYGSLFSPVNICEKCHSDEKEFDIYIKDNISKFF